MSQQVIDVHAHIMFDEMLDHFGPMGPTFEDNAEGLTCMRIGSYRIQGDIRGTPFMDLNSRLDAMDEAGIDVQVLSPSPLAYFHYVEPRLAIEYCRRHNDLMAEAVARHPDRLVGTAALPMQAVDAAVSELERSVKELGLRGAYIGTHFPGALDDPALGDLYQALIELGRPLFIHPAPHGVDGPSGDARLSRFGLDVVLEFAHEETVAVGLLVNGGVLESYGELDICVSHGGGSAAFLYGRMRHAAQTMAWAPEWLKQDGAFDRSFRRLWFDTHVHSASATRCLMDVVDPGRVVIGTNFFGWDQAGVDGIPIVDGVDFSENARQLLRLDV